MREAASETRGSERETQRERESERHIWGERARDGEKRDKCLRQMRTSLR